MKNMLLWLSLLGVSLQAQTIDVSYPPLFASVIGVDKDDSLNIREKPHRTSMKVGKLPPHAYIAIEKCQSLQNSTWCKVYQVVQQFYEGYHRSGWVNARYLNGSNSGYVLIDGIANCDYSLMCHGETCDVVTDYETDKNYNIISLNRVNIKRSRLHAESHFGAMSQEEDGYCTAENKIQDYLKNNK